MCTHTCTVAFEWDEEKRRRNLDEHGVDFRDAALIFENAVVEAEDRRSGYGEIRVRALGHVDETITSWSTPGGVTIAGSSARGRWAKMARKDIKRYSPEELKALRVRGKTRT